MTTFIKKLRQLLQIKKRKQAIPQSERGTAAAVTTPVATDTETVTADNIQRLARLLELTGVDQYSCEETFELLDEYVDLVDNKVEAEALMPVVKQHLDKCPHCSHLFESLLRTLQNGA
jgi:hypothetical protein